MSVTGQLVLGNGFRLSAAFGAEYAGAQVGAGSGMNRNAAAHIGKAECGVIQSGKKKDDDILSQSKDNECAHNRKRQM